MTPRLMQLYALRAQVDALIASEESDLPEATGCPHPEEKRRDTSVMGQERSFLCLACGQVVKGVA